ncbi:MAG: PA domain-containing protein [Acidobacteriota bacterium]
MKLNRWLAVLAALATTLLFTAPAFGGATVTVVGIDPPGVGLNDPTPATPIGGNPGVTLGEQRQIAYQFAANIWGATLESDVEIFVLASFTPLTCAPTSAVLGSAGTTFVFSDFAADARANTWYHSSLADKINGADLNPGFGDIISRFNSLIDDDPTCLGGRGWYYGLDNDAGNGVDFLNVILHEMSHGLGFSNFTNEATGAFFQGRDDIYSVFTRDNTADLTWVEMATDAERVASAINDGNVVWTGEEVNSRADRFLGNRPTVDAGALGTFGAQAAAFGPALTLGGTTGSVVLADDGVDPRTDACEAITNDLTGAIALIDRGGCGFTTKVANAEAAGAIGAIVANNVAGGPAPMGGADPGIGIPSVGITLDQGDLIKANLPGVTVTLGLDPNLLSGADDDGRVRLYAPTTVSLGSSISHWDTVASPNLLMEPFINADLEGAMTTDLTPFQLVDVGWSLMDADGDGVGDIEDACLPSDIGDTVVIGTCDSGVDNTIFANGCSIADELTACSDAASNPFQYLRCSLRFLIHLKLSREIDGREFAYLLRCVIRNLHNH